MRADLDLESERRQRFADLTTEKTPNWEEQFEPGSSGCHEFLDRTFMIADQVGRYLLEHPSCVLDAEWFALANRAATALNELYQKVGAAHLDDSPSTNRRESSAPLSLEP